MSNTEDLNRLNAGELDLSHCDFSGSNFTGRQLPNRDFTRANLQGVQAQAADFRNCDFSAATFQQFDARDAKFTGAKFAGPIPIVNFFGAKMDDVSFVGCSFVQADFSKADITGADFRRAQFMDAVRFDNAIFDETTLFDGATGMRAMASLPVFKNYEFVRGQFVRKAAVVEASVAPTTPADVWIAQSPQVLSEIQKAENALSEISSALPGEYAFIAGTDVVGAGIGHNNPPPELGSVPIKRFRF